MKVYCLEFTTSQGPACDPLFLEIQEDGAIALAHEPTTRWSCILDLAQNGFKIQRVLKGASGTAEHRKAEEYVASLQQCEYCDHWVPGPFDRFCCDECEWEASEERLAGLREAQREYEIYGNDLDSWFR